MHISDIKRVGNTINGSNINVDSINVKYSELYVFFLFNINNLIDSNHKYIERNI